MRIESPCYQCGDRKIGCHAACYKYKSFKSNLKAEKAKYSDYIAMLDYNKRKSEMLKKRRGES